MNKVRFNHTQGKLMKVMILLLLSVLICTTAIFALFYSDKTFGLEGSAKNIDVTVSDTVFDGAEFNGAGSEITKKITVNNNGIPIKYSLYATVSEDTGLTRAVLIYIDGKLAGTLSDGAIFDISSPLYTAEQTEHTIKLVYHIGASEFYGDKTFKLSLNVKAVGLDPAEFLFVRSEKDLVQVLTNPVYSNRKSVLTADVSVTETIVAKNIVNLDLNGKALLFDGGASVLFAGVQAGTSRLYDSKGSATLVGNVEFDMPNALLLSPYPYVVSNYSLSLLESELDNALKKSMKNPLDADRKILQEFVAFTINVTTDPEVLQYRPIARELVPVRDLIDSRTSVGVSVVGQNGVDSVYTKFFDVTVRGQNEQTALGGLLTKEIFYPTYFPNGADIVRQAVTSDLFFPRVSLDRNTVFAYECSAPEILDSDGRFTRPPADANFELTVFATFNNRTYAHVYYLSVSGKSPAEKLKKFRLDNSPIVFSSVGESFELPTEQDYASQGFASFSYGNVFTESATDGTLSDLIADGIFKLENGRLTLVAYTQATTAHIPFTVTIDGIAFSDINSDGHNRLDIIIDIAKNVSIFDAANNFVINAIQNVPDYTVNGFELPAKYSNGLVAITYELPNGDFTVDGVTYQNPDDLSDYAGLVLSGNGDTYSVTIDPYRCPPENRKVFIKMSVEYNGTVQMRAIPFGISGILHNTDEDIPDASLYYGLLKRYDTDGDAFLSRAEINAVQTAERSAYGVVTLDLSQKDIRNLKGIEFFDGVDALFLQNNKIYDLTYLQGLNKLSELDLSYNWLKNTNDLNELINLKILRVNHNDLVEIDSLEKLENLEQFYAQSNKNLENFDVIRNFSKLSVFYSFDTNGSNSALALYAENQNAFITAYQNAQMMSTTVDFQINRDGVQFAPNNEMQNANLAVNKLVPIYEFANVLFLPHTVKYGGVEYRIEWSTNNTSIVQISNTASGARATITQPVADKSLKIFASLSKINSNAVVKRAFSVISIEGKYDLSVEYIENGVTKLADARTNIPDPELRYALFRLFDTDLDNTITLTEISEFKGTDVVQLNDLGINSLKGIEYFTTLTRLNLKNNNFSDYQYLQSLPVLSELSVNGTPDYAQIVLIPGLTALDVTGSTNTKEESASRILLGFFKSKGGIVIYKDVNEGAWDPYAESLAKAVTYVESYYLLKYGDTIQLASTLDINYAGDAITVSLSYTNPNEIAYPYTLENNAISLKKRLSMDTYSYLRVTFSVGERSVIRMLTVVSLSDKDFYVEDMSQGTPQYIPLEEAIPNANVRETVLRQYIDLVIDGKKVISQSLFDSINTITFRGAFPTLKGLQYFRNLTTLAIYGYRPMGETSDEFSVLVPMLTNLTEIAIFNSAVDLTVLKQLPSLKKITANNCLKVNVEYTENGVKKAFFTDLPNLTSLTLVADNIKDFSFLTLFKDNHICNELKIYSNFGSMDALTSSYVGVVMGKLKNASVFNFYVTSSTVLWKPDSIGEISVYVNQAVAENYVYPTTFRIASLKKGDRVLLPSTTSKGAPIEWTSNSGALNIVGNTAEVVTLDGNGNPAYYKSFTTLTGSVPSIATKLVYQFLIEGEGVKKDTYLDGNVAKNVMDYDYFLDGTGIVIEPAILQYFMSLKQISSVLHNGSFYGEFFEKTTVNEIAITTNGETSIYLGVSTFHGIQNFKNLTKFLARAVSLNDISFLSELTELKEISLEDCNIRSLRTSDGESVFARLSQLTNINLTRNVPIDDYSPISYLKDGSVRQGLENLKSLDLTSTSGHTVTYMLPEKRYLDCIVPWNNALNNNYTGVTLKLFNSSFSGAEIKTISDIVFAFQTMGASQEVQFSSPDRTLIAQITGAEGTNYTLKYALDTDSRIKFDGNKVSTITDYGSLIDAKVPMTPYVEIAGKAVFWHQYLIIRDVSAPKTGFVELSYDEYNDRGLTGGVVNAANYLVETVHLIPDFVFSTVLFSTCDVNKDRTLSLTERARLTAVDTTNRDILDITGMELFDRVSTWKFERIKIVSIPKLRWKKGTSLFDLNISRCYLLTDISQIAETYNNGSQEYVKMADLIKYVNLFTCYGLKNDQLDYVAQCSNLSSLDMGSTRYSAFDKLLPLARSLSRLAVNPYSKDLITMDFIRKLILDSDYNNTYVEKGIVKRLDASLIEGLNPGFIADYLVHNVSLYPKEEWTELPVGFTFLGKQYSLQYDTVTVFDSYQIREENGIYSIYFEADAVESVNISAFVHHTEGGKTYRSYTDTITLLVNSEIGSDTGATITLDGDVYLDAVGTKTLLSSVVPDEYLRYYFFTSVDTDKNGVIEYDELQNATYIKLDINNTGSHNIVRYKGIELLQNLTNLEIHHSLATDFSPIARLPKLNTLMISNGQVTVSDTKFLSEISTLKNLTIRSTDFVELNALYDLKNLETVTLETVPGAETLLYMDGYAYAKLDGKLFAVKVGNAEVNTDDSMKKASLILDRIVMPLTVKGGESVSLISTVTNDGKDYSVQYKSASDNVVLSQTGMVSTHSPFRKYAYIIARVNYNGARFERMFVVEVTA